MDAVLNEFVRDKYPEEAEKYGVVDFEIDPKYFLAKLPAAISGNGAPELVEATASYTMINP
jgi:hypothetical protein